jgi:hypothetical protein
MNKRKQNCLVFIGVYVILAIGLMLDFYYLGGGRGDNIIILAWLTLPSSFLLLFIIPIDMSVSTQAALVILCGIIQYGTIGYFIGKK